MGPTLQGKGDERGGFASAAMFGEAVGLTDVFCQKEETLLEESEDEQAVQAFLDGDPAGFERLVRKFRPHVYGMCVRFAGNHHDADDLAQEVFLRAYRGLSRFRRQARFSTWLHRIAVNTCLNWAATRPSKVEDLPDDIPDPHPEQLERISREQRALAVRKAVAGLPAKQRLTLVLRCYHGLPHREIAAVMNSPVGTVKANLYFALRNLKKKLEHSGFTLASMTTRRGATTR